jgi:photosystem II stability/assembly factor-like uncharacterized protein
MKLMQSTQILIIGIFLCIFLSACSKWSVSAQAPVEQKVTLAGFQDPLHGITVGYAGQVYYSEDGGKDWNQAVNHSMCRFGLEIIDADTAIHCGNGGDVGVTTDGGKTWQAAAKFGGMEPYQCRYLSFADSKNGWIASAGKLASTNDLGGTWNEITLPQGIGGIKAIDLRSAMDGCILDSNYILYFTNDGGKTWHNEKILVEGVNLNKKVARAPSDAMRFTDKNHGIIITMATSGEDTRLIELNTSDGGKTWQSSEIPTAVYENSTLYLSKDTATLTIYDFADGIKVLTRNNAS